MDFNVDFGSPLPFPGRFQAPVSPAPGPWAPNQPVVPAQGPGAGPLGRDTLQLGGGARSRHQLPDISVLSKARRHDEDQPAREVGPVPGATGKAGAEFGASGKVEAVPGQAGDESPDGDYRATLEAANRAAEAGDDTAAVELYKKAGEQAATADEAFEVARACHEHGPFLYQVTSNELLERAADLGTTREDVAKVADYAHINGYYGAASYAWGREVHIRAGQASEVAGEVADAAAETGREVAQAGVDAGKKVAGAVARGAKKVWNAVFG